MEPSLGRYEQLTFEENWQWFSDLARSRGARKYTQLKAFHASGEAASIQRMIIGQVDPNAETTYSVIAAGAHGSETQVVASGRNIARNLVLQAEMLAAANHAVVMFPLLGGLDYLHSTGSSGATSLTASVQHHSRWIDDDIENNFGFTASQPFAVGVMKDAFHQFRPVAYMTLHEAWVLDAYIRASHDLETHAHQQRDLAARHGFRLASSGFDYSEKPVHPGVFKFPAPVDKLSAGDYLRRLEADGDPRALLVDTTSVKLAPGWHLRTEVHDASNWLAESAENIAEAVERAAVIPTGNRLLCRAAERRAWVVRTRPKWIQTARQQGDGLSAAYHVLFGLRDVAMAGRALTSQRSLDVLDDLLGHTRALDEVIGWSCIPMSKFVAMQSATLGMELAATIDRPFQLAAPATRLEIERGLSH